MYILQLMQSGLFPNNVYLLTIHLQTLGAQDKTEKFNLLLVELVFAREHVRATGHKTPGESSVNITL